MVYICIDSKPFSLTDHVSTIKKLLKKFTSQPPTDIKELPGSGSNRIYFRITIQPGNTLLASYNEDVNENIAWHSYSSHFKSIGLKVPEVYGRDESYRYFLIQDLGSEDLFSIVLNRGEQAARPFYLKVVEDLIRFQLEGGENLDYDVAYPVSEFNRRSIIWDLNYFKYYFVKTHDLLFDEYRLEDDFQAFADLLMQSSSVYFMYRDFQSRNIMLHNDEPWYIDFQGGRKGPLPYDLASLLYQARANLSDPFRQEMYRHYLQILESELPEEVESFEIQFPYFVLFRTMQVLGAYGYRGMIQRKGHFLTSIPFAAENLPKLLSEKFKERFPELYNVLKEIPGLEQYRIKVEKSTKLKVEITSFSFKKTGYPADHTENGGGFVFDCRALPNPGRIDDLKEFNGTQDPIIHYLSGKEEVKDFLENIYKVVDQSVANYIERGFTNLQVNFGCTGGKHRSVYSAENLKAHLSRFGNEIDVSLKHLQLGTD